MFRDMADIHNASDTGQIYIFNLSWIFLKVGSSASGIHDLMIALRDKTYLKDKGICLKSLYTFKER